jgi:putative hydrolase of the HAD superfamily
MGTVHELSNLDLHAMGVHVLAVDFGGVMADFIDTNTLSFMAEMAEVPLERFEIPYWEIRDRLDRGEYDARTYFQHVLTACGSPVKDGKTLDLLFTIDILGFSHLRPRMVGWVGKARATGIRTVLVSNMAEETYDRLVQDTHWAKSCFDRFVISGILGMNKPDTPIFHHTLNLMQVSPEQVLFIDDSEVNIETAKSMGMQTFQYLR